MITVNRKFTARADREWLLGLDEDPGARNVGHVLLNEGVERLEFLVDS